MGIMHSNDDAPILGPAIVAIVSTGVAWSLTELGISMPTAIIFTAIATVVLVGFWLSRKRRG